MKSNIINILNIINIFRKFNKVFSYFHRFVFTSLLLIIVSCTTIQHQEEIVLENPIYNKAFQQLSAMSRNEIPYTFKDAVLISEKAFHDDTLNLNLYYEKLDSIVDIMSKFIKINGYDTLKTGANFAAYHWMTQKSPMNKNQVCSYDFEDFFGDSSFTSMFVTKLIDTKIGNCVSLPYLYKILTEELGGEAFLARAPQHFYIKHITEEGSWTNIELTNGGDFPRDVWIRASSPISDLAVETGLYMKPLNNKESLAQIFADLANSYISKFGINEDVLKIANFALNIDSLCLTAILLKINYYSNFCKDLEKTMYIMPESSEKFDSVNNICLSLKSKLTDNGYIRVDDNYYNEFVEKNNPKASKNLREIKYVE